MWEERRIASDGSSKPHGTLAAISQGLHVLGRKREHLNICSRQTERELHTKSPSGCIKVWMSAPQRQIGHSAPWHLRLALVDALVTTRTYVHDLLGVQHHGSQCQIPSLRHSTLVEKQESSVAEADAGSLDFALRQQQTFVFCILNVRLGIKESAHFFFPGFFCRWRLASEIPPSDLVRHLSRFPTHNSTDGACNAHSRCTGSNVNNSILALPRIWPHVISHAHPLGELFDCSSADLPPDWRRCIALRIKEEGTCSIEEIDRAAESAAASLTCNVSPAMCNLNMGHEFR